jgi:hypothetical protein
MEVEVDPSPGANGRYTIKPKEETLVRMGVGRGGGKCNAVCRGVNHAYVIDNLHDAYPYLFVTVLHNSSISTFPKISLTPLVSHI